MNENGIVIETNISYMLTLSSWSTIYHTQINMTLVVKN